MGPLIQSTAAHPTQDDVEKSGELKSDGIHVDARANHIGNSQSPSEATDEHHVLAPSQTTFKDKLARLNRKIEALSGLETRGIVRVLPEERQDFGRKGYLDMFLLWFSINLVAANIVIGLLGPSLFQLGWKDSVLLSIFANALAGCGPAYMATFGPQSGNRTMIIARFFLGYWPAKIAGILTVVLEVGWGVIGSIVAGQMFSAVNGAGMSIAVGCIISALLIGVIATFGIALMRTWNRYAYIPQLIACFTLIGSSGKYWDRSTVSVGDPATITGKRCTFFALAFSGVVGFAAVASDFYVYYPVKTSKGLTFLATWSGVWTACVFCDVIGIGIGTAIPRLPTWKAAAEVSSGKLLLTAYDGLGGWGGFCVVVLALGSVTNNAPCSYAAANSMQMLGRYTKAVPRWLWCVAITIVELALSVAGRESLYDVFENFLPIMSYWVCPWLTIVVQEHLLFHKLRGVPFDWTAWEDRKRLPIGAAALLAWLCGWAGAIIAMNQVWWQGPIARKIGPVGGDVGEWVAVAFTGVIYPTLRYIEIRRSGR